MPQLLVVVELEGKVSAFQPVKGFLHGAALFDAVDQMRGHGGLSRRGPEVCRQMALAAKIPQKRPAGIMAGTARTRGPVCWPGIGDIRSGVIISHPSF